MDLEVLGEHSVADLGRRVQLVERDLYGQRVVVRQQKTQYPRPMPVLIVQGVAHIVAPILVPADNAISPNLNPSEEGGQGQRQLGGLARRLVCGGSPGGD